MDGLMMHRALCTTDILRFAADSFPDAQIVSVRSEGDIHRTTYAATAQRVAQLARGLQDLGIGLGDRVATLAWNGYRHFEVYYGAAGIGAVCHTINPRLSAEQMVYIVNHAADRVLCIDLTFVPIVEQLASQFPADLRYVILTDRVHMPDTSLPNALCYEDLLDGQPTTFDWPEFPEETAAALCYTSGTTGHPKGVLYSHRSTVLHALSVAISLPKVMQEGSRILPVVPLFHVNAWGLPYAAPLVGASLIFPGGALDGKSLFDLMDRERVLSAWGVPTVWMGLLSQIQAEGRLPDGFADVVIGGSAAAPAMIEAFESLGVNVCHAWGMTEMSPLGTQNTLPKRMQDAPLSERVQAKSAQGRRVFGVEMKIVDETGAPLPHDGVAQGALYVRGNTVMSGYLDNPQASADALDQDGWFGTGDVGTIDAHGVLQIADRAKDLIKSGGEWISSIDLENVVMAHPAVANCAVIAVAHPKWDERPLLIVVPGPEGAPDKAALIEMLSAHFAKWQLPDDVVFVDALPVTATGKVSKLTLRQQFANHVLQDADEKEGQDDDA